MMWARRGEALGSDRARHWGSLHDGPPGSAGGSNQRVLLEMDDPAEAWASRQVLVRAGYEVTWCPGPGGSPKRSCPLVTRGACPLVDGADAVISKLAVDHDRSRQVLDAHARHDPVPPVVVSCTALKARSWSSPLHGLQALAAPLTSTNLLSAVGAALGRDSTTATLEGR